MEKITEQINKNSMNITVLQFTVAQQEDRLKTLEDKVKVVEKLLIKSKLIRSEDLWDEENNKCACGEQTTIGGANVEIDGVCHSVKHPCYVIKPPVKECKHDWVDMGANYECFLCDKKKDKPTDNSDKIEEASKPATMVAIEENIKDTVQYHKQKKIEEIIRQLHEDLPAKYMYTLTTIESWLRDKLKELI